MADRTTKERKLVALMVKDLGVESESDAAVIEDEAHALSDEELDRTLAGRLDLPYPRSPRSSHNKVASPAPPT